MSIQEQIIRTRQLIATNDRLIRLAKERLQNISNQLNQRLCYEAPKPTALLSSGVNIPATN